MLPELYSDFKKGLRFSPNLLTYLGKLLEDENSKDFFNICKNFFEKEKILVLTKEMATENTKDIQKLENLYPKEDTIITIANGFDNNYYIILFPFEYNGLFDDVKKEIQKHEEYNRYLKLREEYQDHSFQLPFSKLELPIFPVEFK